MLAQIVCDIKLLDMVESEINNSNTGSSLNMNEIEGAYISLLEENHLAVPQQNKTYLKQLILENIPGVHFTRPPDKTKPELVLTTKPKEALLAGIQENAKADMKVLLQAAKILRRDIASRQQWRFQGSFED